MRAIRALLSLLVLEAVVLGHGGNPPPPPEPPPDPPDMPPGKPDLPPPPDIPMDTPQEGPPPETPTPPEDPKAPEPPATPPGGTDDLPFTAVRKPASSGGGTWRMWWEYNREALVGLRATLRRPGTVTGDGAEELPDPLGGQRDRVLAALRKVAARRGTDRTLRAAAILALGRMGEEQDAYRMLMLLRDDAQPVDVHEACAVALGMLPAMQPGPLRESVREHLLFVVREERSLPRRARGLAILSAGLRARDDAVIVMELLGSANGAKLPGEEAANLAYACGLSGNAIVAPDLIRGARKGTFGARKLSDVGRAHVVAGLAACGDPGSLRTLATLLGARSVGVETRRSAALGMGRVLREGESGADEVARAAKALARAFDGSNDPILRGFVAVAQGGARTPLGTDELMRAIDQGGLATVKPFCALALGLAARTLGADGGREIREFLAEELDKTHDGELGPALSIALGLAGATDCREALLERVQKKSLPAGVRGAAAQGLGLMDARDPAVATALEEILRTDKSPELLQDVALALGLLGRRGSVPTMLQRLRDTDSTPLRGRLMIAMAHLAHAAAAEPLLALFEDERERPDLREFAAVALGILGDGRDEDVLFALDAHFNFYATTLATNELIRLY